MLIFTNANIIPIEGKSIERGTLIVEDGKIKNLLNNVVDSSNYPNAEIIDCDGKYITPGLIDAHSHVGLFEEGAGPGNSDGNEMTDPITPHLRALDAIFPEDLGFEDARRSGVTTLGLTPGSGNLIGGQFAVVKTAGTMADEMVILEPAGIKMALGENPKRVGTNKNRAPTTRMGNAFLIRQAFYKAIDYMEEWREYEAQIEIDKMKPVEEKKFIKKPKFDMTMDILSKVLRKELPLRCHAHRADDIRTAIRIADEFNLKLVIEHATEGHKIARFLGERKIPVIVGPLMTSRSKLELRDRTAETPAILLNAGTLVCITTDSPVIPIWMLRDSVIVAIRHGLPADVALELVTINPAIVLGVDDRVGSLKPGKDADFVIWDNDPLDARSGVVQTYINGELVWEN